MTMDLRQIAKHFFDCGKQMETFEEAWKKYSNTKPKMRIILTLEGLT